jgi:hypothetical protein
VRLLRGILPVLLVLLTFSTLSAASPVKARPLTGIGVLLIKETKPENGTLRLYREPKLGRIEEISVEKLPKLSPFIGSGEGRRVAVVTAKRFGWYRIIYDDGEREGWVEGRPSCTFLGWKELLPGRGATLLPGLKKDYYQLRREPYQSSEPIELLGRERGIYCIRLYGEWMEVSVQGVKAGWLRWRDDNGRLLIAVNI